MAVIKSLKILFALYFPTGTVRLIDASAAYMDPDGNLWRPCVLTESALDTVETAINAEALTFSLMLSGIDREIADIAWKENEDDSVIGSKCQIIIQECGDNDQPIGDPEVAGTFYLDDLEWDDFSQDDKRLSNITVTLRNRFTLRAMQNGAVLSDVDQKARAAILNPNGDPDQFCERVPGLADKVLRWPSWN